ncbi:type 2 isopentenyl-diphosphate Delta-isomerase [bacterium]|nr:MAG: type 2 isopentenyl-diphosphate Delta-isomerase [bacterium]RKZ16290.1 MAG: type 2 isopentenyl-diphosphate Delta-isomerase [bacterium]
MKQPGPTGKRKQDHLDLCLDGQAAAFRGRGNGLADYDFVHDALPELDLEAIDLSTDFLGHHLRLPLIISSMTGGGNDSARLNRTLARCANEIGCAIAVGSQRAMLEDPDLAHSFRIREHAPDVPVFGNLGAVQLNAGYGIDECLRAVEEIEADGLFIHLNSLQEALQPEGDTDFSGLVDKLASLTADLPFPVLLKTCGNGWSTRSVRKLTGLPLAAIEASGAGGTSWARVESRRQEDAQHEALFGDFGESTADSILAVRQGLPDLPLIASGGIADGVDVARALALGADLAGLARPLLQVADRGEDELLRRLEGIGRELQIACFYTGTASVNELDQGVLRPRRGDGNQDPGRA